MSSKDETCDAVAQPKKTLPVVTEILILESPQQGDRRRYPVVLPSPGPGKVSRPSSHPPGFVLVRPGSARSLPFSGHTRSPSDLFRRCVLVFPGAHTVPALSSHPARRVRPSDDGRTPLLPLHVPARVGPSYDVPTPVTVSPGLRSQSSHESRVCPSTGRIPGPPTGCLPPSIPSLRWDLPFGSFPMTRPRFQEGRPSFLPRPGPSSWDTRVSQSQTHTVTHTRLIHHPHTVTHPQRYTLAHRYTLAQVHICTPHRYTLAHHTQVHTRTQHTGTPHTGRLAHRTGTHDTGTHSYTTQVHSHHIGRHSHTTQVHSHTTQTHHTQVHIRIPRKYTHTTHRHLYTTQGHSHTHRHTSHTGTHSYITQVHSHHPQAHTPHTGTHSYTT